MIETLIVIIAILTFLLLMTLVRIKAVIAELKILESLIEEDVLNNPNKDDDD